MQSTLLTEDVSAVKREHEQEFKFTTLLTVFINFSTLEIQKTQL